MINLKECYQICGERHYYFSLKESAHTDFLEKHGIKPEKAKPSHSVCSIGFSEKEGKWYGWSHRARYGWGVGDTYEDGDCGFEEFKSKYNVKGNSFKCKTLDDCKKVAKCFADSVS